MIRAIAITFFLAGVAPANELKNVIVLVADDLGLQLGCYGDAAAKTPNIDAMAKAGTRFTHGFASVSSCSPSRATILTGQPTHQCGQYGLAHADHNFASFRKTKSLPGILNIAGYKTGVIGKLHVQPKEAYPFGEEIAVNGRNVGGFAEAAKKFIASRGEKPFYLHVGYADPHRAGKGFGNDAKATLALPKHTFDPKTLPLPYHLPDQPDARKDLAEYYESVARLDHGIGLILKVLDDTKTADNTLVIFVSDNGIPFPGAKTTLYDAGVRLPLIVKKPGQKPGVVNAMLVSFTDLAPTILDWCGLSKPDAMAGKSFLPHLEQSPADGWGEVYGSHQFHEVTMYYPMRMVRTKTHKLILNLAHDLEYPSASDLWGSPTWQGVLTRKDERMGQRTVAAFLHRPKFELYDLRNDPNELVNVATQPENEQLFSQLREKLTTWRKNTSDPWLIKDRHE